MKTVSLIKENFEQRNYEMVVQIARTIPFKDIPLSVLPVITHSYYEIGDYRNSIAFGIQSLKKELKDSNVERRDIELTILAIIASYEKKGERIRLYKYLILYSEIGLDNQNVLNKLKSIEYKTIRQLILILNIICFSTIAITYIIEPQYRKSVLYFLFVFVFFIHLAMDYFKPTILQNNYSKLLRFICK